MDTRVKPVRQVRYGVAMSLDGYIADLDGGADWIVMDPDIDFGEIFSRFDTVLIGRKSYDATQAMKEGTGGDVDMLPGLRSIVISRTMRQEDYPGITVVSDAERFVEELKAEPGKDIWLWGGGELFRSLLSAGLVDGVDVAVIPVLLGGGIPLLPTPAPRSTLTFKSQRVFEKTGIVSLEYDVSHADGE